MAIEVKVPDIGDFTDVPVVSILVSVGDTVAAEDPLIELESDKATMEVPSPAAGTIKEVKVKEGDKVVLSWIKGDRWTVSVDLPSRDGGTPLPSEEMSAGADFLITPRISVGGAVRFGTTERELIELPPEEQTEAGIQLRSAFKF